MLFYENKEENENILLYLSNYYTNFNSLKSNDIFYSFYNMIFKSLDDIILEFEEINNIKSNNLLLSPCKRKLNKNEIIWNYNYTSIDSKIIIFQCRLDEKNKVNVMKIIGFGVYKDSEPSLEVAKLCANLFDKNDYKIVIIVPNNNRGNPIISYNIIYLLSPYILTRNSLRIKKDINMDLFIEKYNEADLFDE